MPPSRIFVYGTLRRCYNNRFARLLRLNARFAGIARISGRLRRIGKYTTVVPSSVAGDSVGGEVFFLKDSKKILAMLDAYEGPSYERSIARVRLQNGKSLDAWVYLRRSPNQL